MKTSSLSRKQILADVFMKKKIVKKKEKKSSDAENEMKMSRIARGNASACHSLRLL